MLIKNGLLFLLEEKAFVKKDILIENGKISKIADEILGDNFIDCQGKYITPGLIDSHSHLGLSGDAMGWEGADFNEASDSITPEVRAIDGINPNDPTIKEALQGGVTTVCTGPGSLNVLGGQAAIISLNGNIVDKMVINPYAGMKCAFGENTKRNIPNLKNRPVTRMGTASLLRKTLTEARNYQIRKIDALEKNEIFDINFKLEPLLPVLNREIPLKAHAHKSEDICTAIRIAKEFNLKLTLDHCTEGHLIADYLREQGYPAIIGPSFGAKTKIELKEKSFKTVNALYKAGVKIAIMTDHYVIPQHALNLCAAMAMKAGLPEFEALKAITVNPAEILNIDNRKGSLKEGLDGDIVIWSNHPLLLESQVEKVYIEGKEII
ncbi:Imidazolonepropionase [Cetobacterium ceti]|uniref:Imidazolonepropionase n=1 Tax=Cetobacterium ceti TaxID=180163 RepID=A0A1T4LBB5_9FUSO|nr:amidohydrolase [Cetobacterium ceti]SJZ51911.1 Imidazolonepropionase [Cetobacterium ceti]